jgi:hypothetical protein
MTLCGSVAYRVVRFSEEDTAVDYFGQQLLAAGYNYYGNEPMYSGITGEEFAADIYLGVVYYQRLRHMVLDKFQVRTTGPVDPVTRQPVKVIIGALLLAFGYWLPIFRAASVLVASDLVKWSAMPSLRTALRSYSKTGWWIALTIQQPGFVAPAAAWYRWATRTRWAKLFSALQALRKRLDLAANTVEYVARLVTEQTSENETRWLRDKMHIALASRMFELPSPHQTS